MQHTAKSRCVQVCISTIYVRMDNLEVIYCLIDINKLIFSRALGTIKKERNEKVLYAVAIESDEVEKLPQWRTY